MINNKTITSAMWLANYLSENRKLITATPNTVLGSLVNKTSSLDNYSINNNDSRIREVNPVNRYYETGNYGTIYDLSEDSSCFSLDIEYLTSVKGSSPVGEIENPHTDLLKKFINDITFYVNSHISTAKDVVNPRVNELSEKINNWIDQYSEIDYRKDFEIKSHKVPEYILNDILGDSLFDFKGHKIDVVPDILSLPEKTYEEIISLLNLDSELANNDLKTLMSEMDQDQVVSIWTEYFSYGKRHIKYGSVFYNDNAFEALNAGLLIYLIADRLYSEVSTETTLSLKEYNLRCINLKKHGGSIIYLNLSKIKDLIDSEILIVKKDSYNKIINVNGIIYDKWLSEGGTPDAILGAFIDNFELNSYPVLFSNKDKLTDKWLNYCVIRDMGKKYTVLSNVKENLKDEFIRSLDDSFLSELELDYLSVNPEFKYKAKSNFEEYLKKIDDSCLDDSYNVALNTIAKCKFYFTSSYDILKDIKLVLDENKKLTIREAGLVASINYLIKYLLSQTTIKNF